MFSGGRGNDTLVKLLKKYSNISLNIIVNAYDDGLSTGRIRNCINDILGPSDVRKNIARLMNTDSDNLKTLQSLIEYRLPLNLTHEIGVSILDKVISLNFQDLPVEIEEYFSNLSFKKIKSIVPILELFVTYLEKNNKYFDFSDCSIGNILFAGFFIKTKSFNKAIKEFSLLCEIENRVFNVTNGANKILVGLKNDGQFLVDESSIVSNKSKETFRNIYLLDEYLSENQEFQISKIENIEAKHVFLQKLETLPAINPEIIDIISESELIIYCPGTQHSSLFPSYLTSGLGKLISANKNAEKIFISNIQKDNDIVGENVNSLLDKFFYFMNEKNLSNSGNNNLVSKFFIQKPKDLDSEYLKFDKSQFKWGLDSIIECDWEIGDGRHFGKFIFKEILNVIEESLRKNVDPFHHTVSIIIPCLNEEKTVQKVLKELTYLSFNKLGISKEIIFVDGGSTDNSLNIAKNIDGIKIIELKNKGRGESLLAGVSESKGDIIAFFPSDGEYFANDLINLVAAVKEGVFKVVYGSRLVKCVNLKSTLKIIYRDNKFGYLISKYGGMLLSILSLIKYNRYISDILTSIKVFDKDLFNSFNLKSKGVELEGELVKKVSKSNSYLLELPIDYNPRSLKDGKKITVLDGIKTIKEILF